MKIKVVKVIKLEGFTSSFVLPMMVRPEEQPKGVILIWFRDRKSTYKVCSDTPFRNAAGVYQPIWLAEPYETIEAYFNGNWVQGMVVDPPTASRSGPSSTSKRSVLRG